MKRLLVFVFSLIIFTFLQAQSSCNVYIKSSFESRCLHTLEKGEMYDEYNGDLIACKGNIITYSAEISTSSTNTIDSVRWIVQGATSVNTNNTNYTATVRWGNNNSGEIGVYVYMSDGSVCSNIRDVHLIDKPIISSSSQPNYDMTSGTKIITVCKGETVYFTDESYILNGDLVGNYWSSPYGDSSEEDYVIESITQSCTVKHRVENNCGCYEEESYEIEVIDKTPLELSCYGTVCAGSTVTYSLLTQTNCQDYFWYVENGTIISGQETPSITVTWDSLPDGYGVVGIDQSKCDVGCPTLKTVKIPIIRDGVEIEGQTNVCEGEAVLYSLPLWGSTEYTWNVSSSNPNNVDVNISYGPNERLIVFNSPGTYTISVDYKCDFLECGVFTSQTKIVTVKPRLRITGVKKICVGDSATFMTEPNVNATWRVYKNSSLKKTKSNVSSFTYAFTTTGRYRVIATNTNYCNTAEFYVEVVDRPPAPTLANIGEDTPEIACPYSSILMQGINPNINYTLTWSPECDSLQVAYGDSVNIHYDSVVCDVNVYNYDNILGCKSDAYVHHVSLFSLAEANLPDSVVVCPETLLSFSVPYQDRVLYKWTIEQERQACASVQGEHLTNSINLLVNEMASFPNTYSFYIYLTRTYCTNIEEMIPIKIIVEKHPTDSLGILGDSIVCQGEPIQLEVSPSDNLVLNNLTWSIPGSTNNYVGQIEPTFVFNTSGEKTIEAFYNDYIGENTYCTNKKYYRKAKKKIMVNRKPVITNFNRDLNNVTVLHPDYDENTSSYLYQWSISLDNGQEITTLWSSSPSTAFQGYGTYCSIVKDSETDCETSFCLPIRDGNSGGGDCIPTNITESDLDLCNSSRTLTFNLSNASDITWTSIPSTGASFNTGSTNPTEVSFSKVGRYSITAGATHNGNTYCGEKIIVVDYLPNFSIENKCDSVVIYNNSQYLTAGNVTCYISNSNNVVIDSFAFPSITDIVSYAMPALTGTYYFSFVYNNHICPAIEVVYDDTVQYNLSITTANLADQSRTCNNTPITLALNNNGSPINTDYVLWSFGDGASYTSNSHSVDHTFKQRDSNYTVTASIKKANGCLVSTSLQITSYNNIALVLNNQGSDVCVGQSREIYGVVSPSANDLLNPVIWSADVVDNSSYSAPYGVSGYVYYTGDYKARIQNKNYCKAEAMTNVGFKNPPIAHISINADRFCQGDSITVSGRSGEDDSHYSYHWEVTDEQTNSIDDLGDSGIISFRASQSGEYTIELYVYDSLTGCSSNIVTRTVYVEARPPAPNIAFGTNMCINNPPVNLITTSTPSNVYWSNGLYTNSADYYHSGWATAYYYSDTSGCKSQEASLFIEPAPNFGAILTGCYQKCDLFFTNHLDVYGLTSGNQFISWQWWRDNTIDASGYGNYTDSPLSLPLNGYGDYFMNALYFNNNCNATSPYLTIEPQRYCSCDSITTNVTYDYEINNCILSCKVYVEICNNGSIAHTFNSLNPQFSDLLASGDVSITDITYPNTIYPNTCDTLIISMEIKTFGNHRYLDFILNDDQVLCFKEFTWGINIDDIDCEKEIDYTYSDVISELSTEYAGYFYFSLNTDPSSSVLALWSEPPQIINFTGSSPIQGLLMLDVERLKTEKEVCFYALTCIDDRLCLQICCIEVEKFLEGLSSIGVLSSVQEEQLVEEEEFETKTGQKEQKIGKPELVPNPANKDVRVIGLENDVVEVVIMDMQGKILKTFADSDMFYIDFLPKGSYIVRILDSGNKVHYQKLIKQ